MPSLNKRQSKVKEQQYYKTLNISVPFISRAKQNREFKGREYQLQAKIGQSYYSISNCMILIRQNKRGQKFCVLSRQLFGQPN